MRKYFYILTILIAVFSASCASEKKAERSGEKEIIIADDFTTRDGEIIIDGTDTEDKRKPTVTSRQSIKEAVKTALDGSEISTMFDGFGNKTEIRTFSNNVLVQSIIARSFADGRRQIFVYGQNGEARNLSAELYEKILTAPGEFLANSAGIFTGKRLPLTLLPEENTDSRETLLPASAFPVVNAPTVNENSQTAVAPEIIKEKNTDLKPADAKIMAAELQNLEMKAVRKKTQPATEAKMPQTALNAKNGVKE